MVLEESRWKRPDFTDSVSHDDALKPDPSTPSELTHEPSRAASR